MPAYLIEGQYQSSEFGEQNMLEIGTLKDGINYFIQFLACTSQYNHSIFQDMTDSFELQNATEKVKANITS